MPPTAKAPTFDIFLNLKKKSFNFLHRIVICKITELARKTRKYQVKKMNFVIQTTNEECFFFQQKKEQNR